MVLTIELKGIEKRDIIERHESGFTPAEEMFEGYLRTAIKYALTDNTYFKESHIENIVYKGKNGGLTIRFFETTPDFLLEQEKTDF